MEIWNACMQEQNSWLQWIECHPGFAGYIQAVGTIMAVVVALLAPMIALWHERRVAAESRRKATLLTIQSLVPTVRSLHVLAQGAVQAIEAQEMTPFGEDWVEFFDRKIYVPPPPELQFLGQMAEVDESLLLKHRDLFETLGGYNATRFEMKNAGYHAACNDWEQSKQPILVAAQKLDRAASNILGTRHPPG